MTNEQAIVILKDTRTAWSSSILVTPDELEALNMAVQALQADGDLISRQSAIKALRFQYPMMPITKEFRQQWEIETKGFREAEEVIMQLPSVAIPTEHDGCKDCKHENKSDGEYPCSYCKQNYKDMWEREKPTDTITMTREEFSEKLMEHYRQGRADEKAYQNGEIMQSFNPD